MVLRFIHFLYETYKRLNRELDFAYGKKLAETSDMT